MLGTKGRSYTGNVFRLWYLSTDFFKRFDRIVLQLTLLKNDNIWLHYQHLSHHSLTNIPQCGYVFENDTKRTAELEFPNKVEITKEW